MLKVKVIHRVNDCQGHSKVNTFQGQMIYMYFVFFDNSVILVYLIVKAVQGQDLKIRSLTRSTNVKVSRINKSIKSQARKLRM